MNSIFKFKQFEVDQRNCAMKINTDGVLLAALAESDQPKRILDIGTGTGVLALMMAQRFPSAAIEAVEIDELAAATAGKNFQNSVFNKRLSVNHIAIEQYSTVEKFDLIIANPPFFVNDLKNVEEKKGIARHASNAFFDALMAKADELLSTNGRFWFILPIKQAEYLIEKGRRLNFNVQQRIELHSDHSKSAFRWIVNLSRTEVASKVEHFYIYESEKIYTQAYRDLLKDFFLGN